MNSLLLLLLLTGPIPPMVDEVVQSFAVSQVDPAPEPANNDVAKAVITDRHGNRVPVRVARGGTLILSAKNAVRGSKQSSVIWGITQLRQTQRFKDKDGKDVAVQVALDPMLLESRCEELILVDADGSHSPCYLISYGNDFEWFTVSQYVSLGDTGHRQTVDVEVESGIPPPTPPGPLPPGPTPTHDRDNDGVPDAEDACPDTPGVKTNDSRTNGCPAPGPVTGFRVIFVRESGVTPTQAQQSAISAIAVRTYLDRKTTPGSGAAGWREYEDNTDASLDDPDIRKLWDSVKGGIKSVPCLVVQLNNKADILPWPKDAADSLKVLKSYGGE